MNISLPDSMREWVEQQIESEGFGTASEFFRSLVRDAQKRKGKEDLDRKLIEAIDSGPATEMTSGDWQHIRSEVRKRMESRPKRK